MKRPLIQVALWYVGGILIAEVLTLTPVVLLSLALTLAAVTAAWARIRAILLGPLLLLAGWTNLTLHTVVISPNDVRRILGNQPALVTVRGRLIETPSLRVYEDGEPPMWRTLAQIDLSALQLDRQAWRPAAGLLAVTSPGALTNFFAGQVVEITGVADLPRIAVAEGTFDHRAYLKRLGIYYSLRTASEQDWRILSSPARAPLADRFRAWARRALAQGLPAEDESLHLEWALTLGWKTALTEQASEPFVRAATYHIFAVDGLRMAIVFGIFFALFRALGFPRAICGLVLLPLIWSYVALTGWPASAIRATVMLTIVIVGWALKRPGDLLNSLFAAALIILVWQPQQLFQAGFQLSFFVVLSMILILSRMRRILERLTAPDPFLPEPLHPRWRRTFRTPIRYGTDLLLTSFAAWLGSLPLVAYYFNIVTPVSTPANVVAVPLCSLVLVSNLACLISVAWFPLLAELFNHAGWLLMESIRVSSVWFAGWPRAFWYISAPSLYGAALYYALLLGLLTGWLWTPKLRLWKLSALALAILIWACQFCQECLRTRLTVLPLNGGIAIHFDPPGNSSDLLVDCGATNSVQFATKPFLRAHGVNSLSHLVLTHGDLRHIGGAELLAELFSVRQICVSPVRFRSPVYRRTLEQFKGIPGKVRFLSRNDRIGPWQVRHPGASDHFGQADDNALVLDGTFYSTRVLLLSDLGRAGQNALLERTHDLRADIIISGLPSASEALAEWLLDSIQPRLIVIADSEFPAPERASTRLRNRLAQRKIPVIYTRFEGAATIEFSRHGWELRTMKGTRICSWDPGF